MPPPYSIIESLGLYLPPQSQSTDAVLQGCKRPLHFPLEKITGIQNRRVAGKDEFSIDLAKKAMADCFAHSTCNAADIDVLICCNISRYDAPNRLSFEPCTAIKLRAHFGCNHALVFDLTNACAGMFTGIYIVDALLKTGLVRNGMVVSGEYITHLTQTAMQELDSFMDARLACLTLGDAGAAVILKSAAEGGFEAIDLQTLGRYSPYCIAKASGQGGMIMHTDSVNLTDAAVRCGAKHALHTLEQAGWEPNSFQQLIMHQTSTLTINGVKNEINKILENKVCGDHNTINNLAQRGNTASTAHFVALADAIQGNHINTGDKVIFSIGASGLTTGTALYVFDDLPDRLRRNDSLPVQPQQHQPAAPFFNPKTTSARMRIESIGVLPADALANNCHSLDMLTAAAKACLVNSSYRVNEIGLLMYSGVYRNEYLLEPAYATLLAGALDMNATEAANQQTLAFDVFNGSIGFLNACFLAQQLIANGNCKTAMIATAETDNNRASFYPETTGIRETASAFILDAHPTTGKGFSQFFFRYFTAAMEADTVYCDISNNQHVLRTEKDAALDDLYIDCIVSALDELQQQGTLDLSSVDVIFPPQISPGFIRRLSEQLDLPRVTFVDATSDEGDLFSSSIPYALNHAYAHRLVTTGNTGLFLAVGSGIQVGCAIYHF